MECGMTRQPPLGHDFVSRQRRTSRFGWSLLGAGVVLVGATMIAWLSASEETANWNEKAEHWQNKAKGDGSHGSQTAGGDGVALRPQVDAAAKAITQLAMPWGELYGSLERTVDETVSLTAILPSPEKGEVRLNGEAKDFAALRSYLKRLSDTGNLTDVRLLRQEVKQSDPQRPIVFSIVAIWRNAT
jgi:hypothetical protein